MKSKSDAYKPRILVIVGPTASGKTALAIKLAKKLGGEVVSADSRQVYRGMDIGTAKPQLVNCDKPSSRAQAEGEKETRKSDAVSHVACRMSPEGIIHHLIDIKNPDEDYTVAKYKSDAIKAIRGILKRGKLPILVGGTGLYVRAIIDNLDIPRVEAKPELRRKLEKEMQSKGLEFLFKKLVELDPEAAYIVDPKNPRRVIRALEVTLATGKPFTAQRTKGAPLFDARTINMKVPPRTLRRRIEKRVDGMMRDGLVEEVNRLYKKYGNVKALDAIGYREIIDYLEKKTALNEAVRRIKVRTWHYARRQMTWFRKKRKPRVP